MENIELGNKSNGELSGQKMYTEEELKRAIELVQKEEQSNIDKRITEALKTREKNLQIQYDKEKEELLNKNLTAEEQIISLQKEISEIKNNKLISDNRLNVERQFLNAGFSPEKIGNVLDNIVSIDTEKTHAIATSILELINMEKEKLNNQYNEKITSIPKPKNNTSDSTNITKEQFNKMSVDEQLKFIGDNAHLANTFLGI